MAPTSKRKVTGAMDRGPVSGPIDKGFSWVTSIARIASWMVQSGQAQIQWRLSAMPSCVRAASPRPEGREYLVLREEHRSLALEIEAVPETAIYESSLPG